MELIKRYKGARIYEVTKEEANPSDADLLVRKVRAEGIHPEVDNMKAEFECEGPTRQEAVEKIMDEIDSYLSEHALEEFAE